MGWLRRTFADPDVERHLLDHEQVQDEVHRHWVAYAQSAAEAALAAVLLGVAVGTVSTLALLLSLVLAGHALLLGVGEHVDRFVVTNLRVFRVSGVLRRRLYTMPLIRILDITVDQPLLGRVFGYGHFTFESAAETQGLRDIRFVGEPTERDLMIQRTIQNAGLRGGVAR